MCVCVIELTILTYINIRMYTCVFDRDAEVALKQVWLQKAGRKLQLIYEGGTLTDCVDEKLDADDERSCTSSTHLDHDYDDETSVELFDVDDQENSLRIPQNLSWLSSTLDLRHRCAHLRNKARNQLISQHRRRYKNCNTKRTIGM